MIDQSLKVTVVVAGLALLTAACGDRPVDRALTGGAIGAGSGAVIGSTVGNPVAGAVIGGASRGTNRARAAPAALGARQAPDNLPSEDTLPVVLPRPRIPSSASSPCSIACGSLSAIWRKARARTA